MYYVLRNTDTTITTRDRGNGPDYHHYYYGRAVRLAKTTDANREEHGGVAIGATGTAGMH
jgi:hypothetical protein